MTNWKEFDAAHGRDEGFNKPRKVPDSVNDVSLHPRPWYYRKSPMGYAFYDAHNMWLFDVQTEAVAKFVCNAVAKSERPLPL